MRFPDYQSPDERIITINEVPVYMHTRKDLSFFFRKTTLKTDVEKSKVTHKVDWLYVTLGLLDALRARQRDAHVALS